MKHPAISFSALSGLLLSCAVGVWAVFGPAPSAYAQLVEPLLEAKSGTFTLISERDGVELFRSKGYFDGPMSRVEKPGGYSVMDGRRGVQFEVSTGENKATRMKIPFFERDKKLAPELMKKYGGGMLGSFRMLLDPASQRLEEHAKEGASREEIQEELPGGRKRSGVRITTPGMTQTLWAHPETGEPDEVVIEIGRFKGMRTILTDFRFGVAVDPSLFSTDAPEGYTLEDRTE